jgi:hypothetical protein
MGLIKMNKKLHIATSPITGTIFCGHVLKDGMTWASNKQDVTIESLVAVSEHVLHFGKPVIISESDGKPVFEIIVKKL